jgi:hypothetical protein
LLVIDDNHPPAGPGGLAQLVRSVAASPGRWAGLVRYRSGERWYQRLEQRANHEHFGSAGAFAVAIGELQERTLPAGSALPGRAALSAAVLERADPRVAVDTFTAGQVRAFGPRHVHEVVNNSAEPAVSIHAYSPSLAGMRRYELTPVGLVLAAIEMAEESW